MKWINHPTIPVKEVHGTRRKFLDAVTGNPAISVVLYCPADKEEYVISRLLGGTNATAGPAQWPETGTGTGEYAFIGKDYRALRIAHETDQSKYTDDSDHQVLQYQNVSFLTVTYGQRPGIYYVQHAPVDVALYIEDKIAPRYEAIPINPKLLVWGGQTEQATGDRLQLHPLEVPTVPMPGVSLFHTVESWPRSLDWAGLTDLLGKTNANSYYSDQLQRLFPVGTLLLRNYEVVEAYTFTSHMNPAVSLNPMNSGAFNYIFRLHFEYRKEGWKKFLRTNPTTGERAWHYLRYNSSNNSIFDPFPAVNMSPFLHTQT